MTIVTRNIVLIALTCNFLILCTPLNGLSTRNTRSALIKEWPLPDESVCLKKDNNRKGYDNRTIACYYSSRCASVYDLFSHLKSIELHRATCFSSAKLK